MPFALSTTKVLAPSPLNLNFFLPQPNANDCTLQPLTSAQLPLRRTNQQTLICQYARERNQAITTLSRYTTLQHPHAFADLFHLIATLETQDLVKEAIMSDTQVGEAPASQFTPKEQALLIAAMSSLKSGTWQYRQTSLTYADLILGPPELDMDLFVRFGNFTAKKTAQNQWGLLKKKLLPRPAEGEEGYKGILPQPHMGHHSAFRTDKQLTFQLLLQPHQRKPQPRSAPRKSPMMKRSALRVAKWKAAP